MRGQARTSDHADPALHAEREMTGQMAGEQVSARAVELEERHPVVLGSKRYLSGNGRVRRFLAELVATVDGRITDDELVVDRVVVVHDEAHGRAGLHFQRLDREVAVPDVHV